MDRRQGLKRRTDALVDRTIAVVAAPAFPLYAGLVSVYVVARAGGFSNIHIWTTDTPSYEETAAQPLFSVSFLGGTRSLTVPLVYKAVSSPDAQIVVQLVISTLCWLVLAVAVARAIRHELVRIPAFATVLAFSLIREVTLWDTYRLSESLTFSLMALMLAAWLELVRRPSPLRAAAVLVVLFFWTFARDSNAYVVLVLATLAAVSMVDTRWRRLKLALAVGCASIFAASFASAEAGKRWQLPVKDVVFRRVLETPDMSRYFAEHGLPVEGNWTVPPWLEQARGVYAGYLVRHPGYTLAAPFHGRQEALYSTPNNLRSVLVPDLGPYNTNEGIGFMRPPHVLRQIFFQQDLRALLALVAGAAAVAIAVGGRVRPELVWIVPVVILATTYPHLLVVWHFSGYEVDRHALQAAILLRLGAFLLFLFALDRAVRAVSASPCSTPCRTTWRRA
jgi:hypothetical protein